MLKPGENGISFIILSDRTAIHRDTLHAWLAKLATPKEEDAEMFL